MAETEEDWVCLDEIFQSGTHEIIAAMWTFDQGLLQTDILNSRMTKFPLEKVWRAKLIVDSFGPERREALCRAIHILDRLK